MYAIIADHQTRDPFLNQTALCSSHICFSMHLELIQGTGFTEPSVKGDATL
jgi:hypothetical protein